MTDRQQSLLQAAATLLGPSVGGTEENFARIAREAVERALFLERILAQQTGSPTASLGVAEIQEYYRKVGAV